MSVIIISWIYTLQHFSFAEKFSHSNLCSNTKKKPRYPLLTENLWDRQGELPRERTIELWIIRWKYGFYKANRNLNQDSLDILLFINIDWLMDKFKKETLHLTLLYFRMNATYWLVIHQWLTRWKSTEVAFTDEFHTIVHCDAHSPSMIHPK